MLSHVAEMVLIHCIWKSVRCVHGRFFFENSAVQPWQISNEYLQTKHSESYNLQMSTDFSQRGATERQLPLHMPNFKS